MSIKRRIFQALRFWGGLQKNLCDADTLHESFLLG